MSLCSTYSLSLVERGSKSNNNNKNPMMCVTKQSRFCLLSFANPSFETQIAVKVLAAQAATDVPTSLVADHLAQGSNLPPAIQQPNNGRKKRHTQAMQKKNIKHDKHLTKMSLKFSSDMDSENLKSGDLEMNPSQTPELKWKQNKSLHKT
jgi:hypothetical protein